MLWSDKKEYLGIVGKFISRRDCMNPVIGLDISKEESHVQAFLERGKPYVPFRAYSGWVGEAASSCLGR
jgi:hypothetical protein